MSKNKLYSFSFFKKLRLRQSLRRQKELVVRLSAQSVLIALGQVPMAVDYALMYLDAENGTADWRRLFDLFVDVALLFDTSCTSLVYWMSSPTFRRWLCCGAGGGDRKDTQIPTVTPITAQSMAVVKA